MTSSASPRPSTTIVPAYARSLLLLVLLLTLGQLVIQGLLHRQEQDLGWMDAVEEQLFLSRRLNAAQLPQFQRGLERLADALSGDAEARRLLLRALEASRESLEPQRRNELVRDTLDQALLHFQQRARSRLRVHQTLELALLALVLVVLAADTWLVFRPAATQLQMQFLEAEGRRQQLSRHLQQLHRSHENIKADLKAAADVQRSLLPREVPRLEGWDFAWSFKASHDVAGDMFNLIRLDEQRIGIYVLDVSGHGIPAALLSVSLSRVINANLGSILKRRLPEAPYYQIVRPAEVASELNRRFPVLSESDQFFTLIYGILDCSQQTFTFVQAGHSGPIHVSEAGSATWEDAPNPPIGILPDLVYSESTLQLKPGDQIYLYTDGMVEAHNPKDELFGLERILAVLEQNRNQGVDLCLDAVYEELCRFTQGRPQKDDITMLAFGLSSQVDATVGGSSITSEVTSSGRFRSYLPKSEGQELHLN